MKKKLSDEQYIRDNPQWSAENQLLSSRVNRSGVVVITTQPFIYFKHDYNNHDQTKIR